MAKKKRTSNDLQNITQKHRKSKDRTTQTQLKSRGELGAPKGLAVPAPLVTLVVLLNDTNIILDFRRNFPLCLQSVIS
jgi:hypothetical protein